MSGNAKQIKRYQSKLTVTAHTLTNSTANETAACTSLAGPTKRCKRCGETTRAYEITLCKYDITRRSINSLKTQYSNHVIVNIYATTIHIKQRFSIINNKVAKMTMVVVVVVSVTRSQQRIKFICPIQYVCNSLKKKRKTMDPRSERNLVMKLKNSFHNFVTRSVTKCEHLKHIQTKVIIMFSSILWQRFQLACDSAILPSNHNACQNVSTSNCSTGTAAV
jgi:hypothetical protein